MLSKDYTTKWLGMEEEITDRKAETDKKCAHARNHVFMRGMDTARRTTRGLEHGLLALFVFCAQFLQHFRVGKIFRIDQVDFAQHAAVFDGNDHQLAPALFFPTHAVADDADAQVGRHLSLIHI